MKIFYRHIFLCICLIFLSSMVTLAESGELIQPTRTLQSPEKMTGKISVFSEPPGLDVFLNHSKIGKTPVIAMEVKAGTYSLEVQKAKTQIYVMPGKSIRLSLFKNTFINVKEPKKEKIQKPAESTSGKNPVESKEEKTGYQPQYDPNYWPLKPNGPIK